MVFKTSYCYTSILTILSNIMLLYQEDNSYKHNTLQKYINICHQTIPKWSRYFLVLSELAFFEIIYESVYLLLL